MHMYGETINPQVKTPPNQAHNWGDVGYFLYSLKGGNVTIPKIKCKRQIIQIM